ncbi:MAG: zinc metalloprotease HtpX [Nanoarchaeota archaeon]|nr:zinc metalloprotease HtpX [Nanoarchaeota archaeon]MBU1946339.1 zinc metalloprotease HtpX [Nanoarchaeota archaeon]
MKNQFKTVILLGLLTGILLWIGSFWGQSGLLFALVFSILMNFFAYWFSDKIALAIYRAKHVTEEEAPKLYRIVREVSHLAKIPMPKVYIIPSNILNAFATGRGKNHSAVAATQGILDALNDDELKGVIAHEVSHIKNSDILIQSVAATIAGVIGYIAMIARWGAIFGGFGGRDRRGGSGIELLILAILTPILATIIRLAISRSREYLADESGAKLLHNGYGLANALEKLEKGAQQMPLRPTSATETTAHMMIVSPFRGGGLVTLFSTHPDVKSRVKRLRSMNF